MGCHVCSAEVRLDKEAQEHEAEDSLEWLEDQLTPCNKNYVDVCMWPFTAPVSIMQAMTSPPMKVSVRISYACTPGYEEEDLFAPSRAANGSIRQVHNELFMLEAHITP